MFFFDHNRFFPNVHSPLVLLEPVPLLCIDAEVSERFPAPVLTSIIIICLICGAHDAIRSETFGVGV